MTQEPKPGKRIVSRRDYAIRVAKRERLRWGSTALAIFIAVCIISGVGFIFAGLLAETFLLKCLCFVAAALCLPAICIVKNAAEKAMQIAQLELDVVPLTRANTADLPAPNSLVRASEEPAQAQEGVLLRAAVGAGQAEREGQLLRASVGREQE